MSSDPTPIHGRRTSPSANGETVATYCSRPGCGQEYRRTIQPGHPQIYCTESCRRKAQQETRRIRSRLRDLEATVSQQRKLLAAYGSETASVVDPDEALAAATRAIDRAGGVVETLGTDTSPVANALRYLYAAVAPLVEAPQTANDG